MVGRVVETRSVLRDAHGRIIVEATSPRRRPEELPPAIADIWRRQAIDRRFAAASPRAELLKLTAWLLDRLVQQKGLQQLRALFVCRRCGVVTVSENGRRDRGPRRVCEPCRPLERRDTARHRKARERAR
jgi:hypothetical protein